MSYQDTTYLAITAICFIFTSTEAIMLFRDNDRSLKMRTLMMCAVFLAFGNLFDGLGIVFDNLYQNYTLILWMYNLSTLSFIFSLYFWLLRSELICECWFATKKSVDIYLRFLSLH